MTGASFSSRAGFLLASIGFAVGLGNIWRFPYVTGENGGSAFVLVYLACVFLIGVPILMAEIVVGRRGRGTPPLSLALLSASAQKSQAWSALGYLNLATAFLIVMAYTIVAGWVIYYLFQAMTGGFNDMDAHASFALFRSLTADTPTMMGWATLALLIAGGIVAAGVTAGIERAVIVLMPLLFALLAVLALYNVVAGGMDAALTYLFTPDFSKLAPSVFLAAVAQAFFSIGVAMAGMMMFGAYLPEHVSIAGSALVIVIADTLVALVAGLVIFPMVFNHGLDPAGGTGLIFQTLPVAFAQMPGGFIVASLFFLLLSVAAITSLVGLIEPLIAWIAERLRMRRLKATVLLLVVMLAFTLISALSYNTWSKVSVAGSSLSAVIDFIPNQVMLPLGGLGIALFVGWVMNKKDVQAELKLSRGQFRLWYQLLRFAVVPAVFLIFLSGLL